MPDDGLELLGVGGDGFGRQRGNDEAGIGDPRGVAAIASDNAKDAGACLAGETERRYKIHADPVLRITATDGEDEDGVTGIEAAAKEPVGVAGIPAVVVDAGG